jgi:predicted P-loop ATPase
MNELSTTKNLTPQQFRATLELNQVQAVGFVSNKLELGDYEKYFRSHYLCRFNEVSTNYESARYYDSEDDVDGQIVWEELNINELHNDLVRARAKERGELSETQVARMLGDRRLVPSYDPLAGYFNEITTYLPSDDKGGYIDEFASYVKVEGGEKEQQRWLTNFKKALVRTVKCALNPSYFNKQCLTLHSTDQNVGKTSFLRTLVPPQLKSYYYEGAIGSDKDSQTVLTKNFIILIDELANLSRLDINVLKAIMSKLSVNIRLPYAKNFKEFPRRASFFATTNRADFLTDNENVRWVIFSVESIDKGYGNIFTGEYKIDINKVWCEAYRLYQAGFPCEMNKSDLASNEDNNVLYSATSSEKEVINTYFEKALPADSHKKGFRRLQSGEIFELACQLLASENKEYTLKNIKQSIFFNELARQWKKTSYRIGSKVTSGYCFLVISEKEEGELPF